MMNFSVEEEEVCFLIVYEWYVFSIIFALQSNPLPAKELQMVLAHRAHLFSQTETISASLYDHLHKQPWGIFSGVLNILLF